MLLLSIFFCAVAFSQPVYYAAAKAGLSMREQPGTSAKLLQKIPYGEKIVLVANNDQQVAITAEGFTGYWWKVKYKEQTGYIVNSYTLPVPAPKTGTKTVTEYFAQLSSADGNPLIIKSSEAALHETGISNLTKQLFKNGMEWQKTEAYEFGSEIFMLPGFSIEQCFLLLRLIDCYANLVGENNVFPAKNSTVKNDTGEKTIEVERENFDGKPGPVKKLKIIVTQGAITELEIFMLDTQAVIYWSSGI